MASANTRRTGTRDPPVPHGGEPYPLCPRGSASADRCAGIALLSSRRRIVASVSARSRTHDDEPTAVSNVMRSALALGVWVWVWVCWRGRGLGQCLVVGRWTLVGVNAGLLLSALVAC